MSKIYQPTGRAREYSPLALNLYKGCTHGCKYCYVPRMLGQWNKHYDHSDCQPNVNYTELEKSAQQYFGIDKQILLSFTGDPYCGIDNTPTRKALEILNRYQHKVAILTKGGTRCLKDLDLFKQFGNRIKVGATLTFDNLNDSMEWEPGGATPQDRIEALKQLHEEGITTWASFEPVVIPEQSLHMLELAAPYLSHVKIGKLNNYNGMDANIDWSRFIYDSVKICRDNNLPFYIKKDLACFNRGVYLSGNELNEDYLNL